MHNITVLIIGEDKESAASLLKSYSSVEKVLTAAAMESAESDIVCHSPDLIISELSYPDIDLILLQSNSCVNSPFILLMSCYDHPDYLKLAREMGAGAFCLEKDLNEALIYLMRYFKTGINSSIFKNKYYLLK
jgi:DNA-binding NarL/FixJ family response regulator